MRLFPRPETCSGRIEPGRYRRRGLKVIRAGVGIEPGNFDVDRFQDTVEHFAGFFDRRILTAKEQFDMGVRFERFWNGEFHQNGLTGRNRLDLLRKRFRINGKLMSDEMDHARRMVRDGELGESRAERIRKRYERCGDVRGGRFPKSN